MYRHLADTLFALLVKPVPTTKRDTAGFESSIDIEKRFLGIKCHWCDQLVHDWFSDIIVDVFDELLGGWVSTWGRLIYLGYATIEDISERMDAATAAAARLRGRVAPPRGVKPYCEHSGGGTVCNAAPR